MKIFAISDLHLGIGIDKPMDVFGSQWTDHWQKISEDWNMRVSNDDLIIVAGDISWTMTFENAKTDLNAIAELKGSKIFVRGNHDYWWHGISKIRATYPPSMFFLQNNAIKIGNYIFAGTRGWPSPEVDGNFPPSYAMNAENVDNTTMYKRETIRLELSLIEAQKIKTGNDRLIGIIHYPPFNSRYSDSNFTQLFEKFSVSSVIYGHLHGTKSRTNMIYSKSGIKYYLTSCDLLNFKLLELEL
ncbi:MAG: metallophosphoesterase [Christensenellaceae bacterium]|jgi:predicted phosphohydrolase|nr:metallophosphoesterase [Christensenellaceae bacterium]